MKRLFTLLISILALSSVAEVKQLKNTKASDTIVTKLESESEFLKINNDGKVTFTGAGLSLVNYTINNFIEYNDDYLKVTYDVVNNIVSTNLHIYLQKYVNIKLAFIKVPYDQLIIHAPTPDSSKYLGCTYLTIDYTALPITDEESPIGIVYATDDGIIWRSTDQDNPLLTVDEGPAVYFCSFIELCMKNRWCAFSLPLGQE